MTDAPSKSQVDKAGARLRRWLEGGTDEDLETPEMEQAMRVLVAWRAGVFGPLASVMSGVTVAMERGGVRGRLTSRPKRYGRIIEKLGRLHRMRLSQMEDIGGCRVVLDTLEEVHRLRDHLLAAWPDAQTDDYIAFPKHTGYRAIPYRRGRERAYDRDPAANLPSERVG
jgi:putative GTP pyrophosphokinase